MFPRRGSAGALWIDGFAGSAGQPGGAEGAELPGHGEAKVVIVVQIGFFCCRWTRWRSWSIFHSAQHL